MKCLLAFCCAAVVVAIAACVADCASGRFRDSDDMKVVVLMLENRGLAHFFAADKSIPLTNMPKIGEYFNTGNDGTKWYVNDNASYVALTDPDHSFEAMNSMTCQ